MEEKRKRNRGKIFRTGILSLLFSIFLCACGKSPEAARTERTGDNGKIELKETVFVAESVGYQEEVSPESPRGYYDYYEAHDGYRYLVIKGTVINKGEKEAALSSCKVVARCGKKEREGALVMENEIGSSFEDTIGAGEEKTGYLIALVKEEEEPEVLEIYYNADWSAPGENEAYDCAAEIEVKGLKTGE